MPQHLCVPALLPFVACRPLCPAWKLSPLPGGQAQPAPGKWCSDLNPSAYWVSPLQGNGAVYEPVVEAVVLVLTWAPD